MILVSHFKGSMFDIETTGMMSDVGLNILQLRILLYNLRHKIGVNIFELEISDSTTIWRIQICS